MVRIDFQMASKLQEHNANLCKYEKYSILLMVAVVNGFVRPILWHEYKKIGKFRNDDLKIVSLAFVAGAGKNDWYWPVTGCNSPATGKRLASLADDSRRAYSYREENMEWYECPSSQLIYLFERLYKWPNLNLNILGFAV